MGDDVRWVGNEKGIGRKTEWSATVLTPGIYSRAIGQNKELGVFGKSKRFGKPGHCGARKRAFLVSFGGGCYLSVRAGFTIPRRIVM